MNGYMRYRPGKLSLLTVFSVIAAMSAVTSVPVSAQQPDMPLFVTAAVDNNQPYLGEQVSYIFRIHRRTDVATGAGQVEYNPPSFEGFWNSGVTEQQEYDETITSGSYRVVELRTVLFPSVAGAITIGPGTLSLLDSGSGAPATLESSPVTMDIQPLPPSPVPQFNGAVGRFAISAAPATTSEQGGGTVQLAVKVEGEGNIDALNPPKWPDFQHWRVIETPSVTDSRIIDGTLTGSRTYTLTLLPQFSGDLTIPQISYAYFDPHSEEYHQVATNPISVSVAAEGLPQVEGSTLGDSALADEENAGLRPIKTVPSSLRDSALSVTDNEMYWAAWAVPLLAIAAALVWRRRQIALENARAESYRRNALANARREMERAISGGADPRTASSDALLSYLAIRLDTSLTRLTRYKLLKRLHQAGLPTDVAHRVESALDAGEEARYAPASSSAGNVGEHQERATRLLADLEDVLGV